LTRKYVAIAATSGRGSVVRSSGRCDPPSHVYTNDVATIVTASAAALNAVRYSGYGCLTLTVHCVHTPATPAITAYRGPRSSNAMTLAAYETDSVDPLATGISRLTFQIDVRQDERMRIANSPGSGNESGSDIASAHPPTMITPATKIWALVGSAVHTRPARDATLSSRRGAVD